MARRSNYPAKRDEILRAVAAHLQHKGKTPTVRELAERTNLSVGTLHSYMERLAEEGLIEWRPRQHRSIRLTQEGTRIATTQVPF